MADLLEIFSTLLHFFAFVPLAAAVVCVPVLIALWSSELVPHISLRRRRNRRHVDSIVQTA
jgi:hypothetical protein